MYVCRAHTTGKGTVIYAAPDGGVAEKYEGEWLDGKMHGYGKYYYGDGGMYEGDWVDGKVCTRSLAGGDVVYPRLPGSWCSRPGRGRLYGAGISARTQRR